MKELKKSPRQQLEKFSTIFMQLGLVLGMFIVFITLEHETEEKVAFVEPSETKVFDYVDFDKPKIFTKQIIKKIQPKVQKPITKLLEKPEIVKNIEDVNESVIIPTPDEEPNVDIVSLVDEEPEDDIILEDDEPIGIPFISKVPVFSGCENLSEKEARKCFDKKMNKHVRRHFNTDLANELGLKSGRNKILTEFVIDKSGNIKDIKIRAPHAKLKKETQRVINKIPSFTPGENNGSPVNVRYALPINFQVQ